MSRRRLAARGGPRDHRALAQGKPARRGRRRDGRARRRLRRPAVPKRSGHNDRGTDKAAADSADAPGRTPHWAWR